MKTTIKPILERTAEDLMSRDVITIPSKMSLRAAAHLLAQSHVSGAPVIDETGRCVGVLSAVDLVNWVDRGELAAKRGPTSPRGFCCEWEVIELGALPADAVSCYMTTSLVTARPDALIGELARWMLDAHIHRIIIVDEVGKPIGIVSSTDILAAVAREEPPSGAW
jgi:CBS-domain-containing membrane protein